MTEALGIGTSDGQSYSSEWDHVLSQLQTVGQPTEAEKSMTHTEVQKGKDVPPLLTLLANKVKETNDTIGQLMTGQLDPASEEGIHKVTDLVMKTAGYGMLGAEKDAFGIFGGRMSAGARMLAENLEKAGVGPSKVKEWTGLERGAEGMWRSEISDQTSKIKIPMNFHGDELVPRYVTGEYTAGEIVDHPEFFKGYPEARDLQVNVRNLPKGYAGQYTSGQFIGGIEQKPYIDLNANNTPEKMRNALIHELQHYVQEKEGFAFSNPSDLTPDIRNAVSEILKNRGYFDKYSAKYRAYRALAEEVEAFNTGNRIDMTKSERLKSLARDTEDIPRDVQLVAKGPPGLQDIYLSKYSKKDTKIQIPPENARPPGKGKDWDPNKPDPLFPYKDSGKDIPFLSGNK